MTDAFHAGDAVCLPIPRVDEFEPGDWTATIAAMGEGCRLEFAQSWRAEPEADLRPGYVRLGVCGGDLAAYAFMEDAQPRNTATRWNDPTWTTGDVLELFFHADGRPGYHEFHVTPENHRLQLFFPNPESFRQGRGHRHWAVEPPLFSHSTRIHPSGLSWECALRVPLARVLDEPRGDGSRRFRFSFSRYDFQPGRIRPVTSSTSRLTRHDFHHIPDWTWAEAAR